MTSMQESGMLPARKVASKVIFDESDGLLARYIAQRCPEFYTVARSVEEIERATETDPSFCRVVENIGLLELAAETAAALYPNPRETLCGEGLFSEDELALISRLEGELVAIRAVLGGEATAPYLSGRLRPMTCMVFAEIADFRKRACSRIDELRDELGIADGFTRGWIAMGMICRCALDAAKEYAKNRECVPSYHELLVQIDSYLGFVGRGETYIKFCPLDETSTEVGQQQEPA